MSKVLHSARAITQGDHPGGRALYEESLGIVREIKDLRSIAIALNNLGLLVNAQGDAPSARAYYKESLTLFRKIGDRALIASSLESFAGLTASEKKTERDAALCGAAAALREEIGFPILPEERETYVCAVAELRETLSKRPEAVRRFSISESYERTAASHLGDEAFSVAWAQGRSMSLEQAIEYALGKDRIVIPFLP